MKTYRLVLSGLAVLLVFASAACSTEVPVPEEVVAAPAEVTPEEAIEGFYRWYAGYPGNPVADGILVTSPMVTEGLLDKMRAIVASFENTPGGHDPILCAQDRPRSLSVEVTDRSLDSAAAVVRTEFEGHKIYVGAVKVDGQWMIADVTCPTDPSPGLQEEEVIEPETPVPTPIPTVDPSDQASEDEGRGDEEGEDEVSEADATADWPIFRDEAYGFQIAYPPGWGFMDLPLYDPGEGPPTVIQRIVIVYPQGWEERLKPGGEPDPNVDCYPAFNIQVSVGTMEAYRREFMALAASETMEINGLGVLHEWDTRDDYNLAQYTFQHPTNGELRVTLTDPVSGFSQRAAENPDIVTLIPQVVSTLRFTE
jgi:hypothetical protein